MATIKSYTDLEQSRKLEEFLPLESSDYCWISIDNDESFDGSWEALPKTSSLIAKDDNQVSCWSLSALLSVFPKIGSEEPMIQKLYYDNNPTERYICQYSFTNITGEYDNPIDACYELVIRLNELNLL